MGYASGIDTSIRESLEIARMVLLPFLVFDQQGQSNEDT